MFAGIYAYAHTYILSVALYVDLHNTWTHQETRRAAYLQATRKERDRSDMSYIIYKTSYVMLVATRV